MKQFVFVCSFVLLQSGLLAQSWKSPEYKAVHYRKVIVLAKTSDELAKRQMEDAAVKMLNENGIVAIPAYSNITDKDLTDEETLIAKADSLEADALLVYTIAGKQAELQNKPSVNVSTGVPVKIGIFRGFIGGNVPLAGGVKQVDVIKVNAVFYNRSSQSMQWSYPLSGKLKGNTEKLAASFAKTTVKAMLKDKLFVLDKTE